MGLIKKYMNQTRKPRNTVIAEDGKDDHRYRVEKDSVQETLMIPLIGRKVCSDHSTLRREISGALCLHLEKAADLSFL